MFEYFVSKIFKSIFLSFTRQSEQARTFLGRSVFDFPTADSSSSSDESTSMINAGIFFLFLINFKQNYFALDELKLGKAFGGKSTKQKSSRSRQLVSQKQNNAHSGQVEKRQSFFIVFARNFITVDFLATPHKKARTHTFKEEKGKEG